MSAKNAHSSVVPVTSIPHFLHTEQISLLATLFYSSIIIMRTTTFALASLLASVAVVSAAPRYQGRSADITKLSRRDRLEAWHGGPVLSESENNKIKAAERRANLRAYNKKLAEKFAAQANKRAANALTKVRRDLSTLQKRQTYLQARSALTRLFGCSPTFISLARLYHCLTKYLLRPPGSRELWKEDGDDELRWQITETSDLRPHTKAILRVDNMILLVFDVAAVLRYRQALKQPVLLPPISRSMSWSGMIPRASLLRIFLASYIRTMDVLRAEPPHQGDDTISSGPERKIMTMISFGPRSFRTLDYSKPEKRFTPLG
ncbi:hypothetical protein C8J56DRAFT_1065093 [Mycena floridula]|nr:hypothetical protein C8J56DRAFT_1065093 [Mycena floridula]